MKQAVDTWVRAFFKHWLLVPGFILLLGMLFIRPYTKHKVIEHDVTSYYSYLPALFIHQDLTDYSFAVNGKPYVWVEHHPEGFKHFKMTNGVALLWLPFFTLANLVSPDDNSEFIHGYEMPFQLSISLAALLYCLLGLWALKRFLQLHVSERHAIITCILLLLGSNLLYYTVVAPGMSHVYSFCLLALLLDRSKHGVSNKTTSWHLLLLGVLAGWIVLIRPVNAILVLGVFTLQLSLGKRVEASRWGAFLGLGILGAVLICIPQISYWYYVSGKPVLYSYGDEGFHFSLENILKGWVGFRKGAIWYSPILLLLLGLAFPWVTRKIPKPTLLVLFLVSLLFGGVVFSWWCWWYGGGYGARILVEWYPLMAILLALVVSQLWSNILFKSLVLIILTYSVYFTWQANLARLHYDAMTPKAFGNLLAFKAKHIDSKDLFYPDYTGAKYFGQELHYDNKPVSYVRSKDLFFQEGYLKNDVLIYPGDSSYHNVHVQSKVKHFSEEPIFLVIAAHDHKTNELIRAVQIDLNKGNPGWKDMEIGMTPNYSDTLILKRYIHNPNGLNHVIFLNQ